MSVNSIKKSVKKYTPQNVKNGVRDIKVLRETLRIFRYDKQRFLRSYSTYRLSRNSRAQLEARITFHAHALEKGMSHIEIRYGFGLSALEQLSKSINAYNDKGFDKSSRAYANALSVIKEYMQLHEKQKQSLDFLTTIFRQSVIDEANNTRSDIGGVYKFDVDSKHRNGSIDFKELFLNRWSVREYADNPVDIAKIKEAISIAMKSPSICNRQASRVTVVTDPKKIEQAIKIQNGMTGYKLPPALLMVTTDTSAFVDVTERNQVYIDGGLFSMSLLLALEYVTIAACPLNAMLSVARDKKMRAILDVPSNENIIMFISIGNFMGHNKVPKSFRYDPASITKRI